MSNLPTVLSIDSFVIRQDADGRCCLNDLHKASGGEQRHRPKYWLANQQTKDLIEELRKPSILSKGVIPPLNINQPVGVIYGGKSRGTYVVRELVYAYAMWISPRFHLQVIRAFDAMQREATPETLPARPETRPAIPYIDPVTPELRAAINRRAHALSLLQYDRLRDDITALVRGETRDVPRNSY
jgi:hypothetical protein